jgi:acyl carrier protein
MSESNISREDDLAKRVIRIIAEESHDGDESGVSLETKLDELGLDSFGVVSIIFELEEEFSVHIPSAGFRELKTVGDVVIELRALTSRTQVTD